MFPMKTIWIFQSRWMALIFAAGIIWFAYDVATWAPQDDGNASNESAALNAL